LFKLSVQNFIYNFNDFDIIFASSAEMAKSGHALNPTPHDRQYTLKIY